MPKPRIRAQLSEFGISVYGAPDAETAADHLATVGAPDESGRHLIRIKIIPQGCSVTWERTVPGCPEWCGEGHRWHHHTAQPHSRGAFTNHTWAWWVPHDYIEDEP